MKGFIVTIAGDYFGTPVKGDRRREKFPYRIQLRVVKAEGALSVVKNKLLDKALRRSYDNYSTYRTHQLVSITNMDGSKVSGLSDPRLMDFNDLADYVRRNNLPLKLDLYTDLDYFRKMVFLAETNQRAFKIKQAQLAIDVKEDRALAALNPELEKSLETSQHFKISQPSKIVNERVIEDCPIDEINRDVDFHKTSITEGENPKAPEIKNITEEKIKAIGAVNKIVEDEGRTSPIMADTIPKEQKVEMVYDARKKGYVPVDEFEEDFDRPEEKEYEEYSPEKGSAVVIKKADLVDEL